MENVDWPSLHHIPEPVKAIIARFYSLVDSSDPNSSRELAETVFMPDGEFVVNKRSMQGPQEIANWRTGGDAITLRQHVVHKIYTCNDRGDDLLMTGTVALGMETGLQADSPYCARCVVDDATSDAPRIKYWQGWFDTAPFAAIIGLQREKKPASGVLDTIGGR